MKPMEHLKQTNYWIKIFAVALVGGFLLKWAVGQNTTINEYLEAIAKTNIAVILGIELFDKVADRLDYTSWANAIYQKAGGKGDTSWLGGLLLGGIAFFAVLFIMAGTMSLTFSTYTPGVLLAAMTYALYIVAPETGNAELLLILWLIAQVATGGAYLKDAINVLTLFKTFSR